MEALESNFDLWLLTFDLCIRCYIFSKLRQRRGGILQSIYTELFSPILFQLPGGHNKLNPINSMRPGEEKLIERKQFQIIHILYKYDYNWKVKSEDFNTNTLWKPSISFIHSFVRSFVHSFIHSFIHSFVRSFVHSFIHSFVRSFVRSFIHSFIYLPFYLCICWRITCIEFIPLLYMYVPLGTCMLW